MLCRRRGSPEPQPERLEMTLPQNKTTPDWPYSEREMQLIRAAVGREANPPARRTGVGAVARPGAA